jgi:hypothetical protein
MEQDQLTIEELRIVARNLKPNIIAMPLLASLIGLMFWQWVPHALVVIWWCLVFVAAFPLHIVSQRFCRIQESARLQAWLAAFCATISSHGQAWRSCYGFPATISTMS